MQEEHLELAIPPWWTREPQLQFWQTVCSSIEHNLPEIIKDVEDRLHKETIYPSSAVIKQIFTEQVAEQLSPWKVQTQDRDMVAGYVTPLLLEKTAKVLKAAIDVTHQDAITQWLAQVANALDKSNEPKSHSLHWSPEELWQHSQLVPPKVLRRCRQLLRFLSKKTARCL